MHRVLASPKWIVGAALAAAGAALFVALGFWQLGRLEERRAFNAALAERLAEPPVDAAALAGADPGALAYRRVRLTGSFAPEREVLLAGRTSGGRPGNHVLTPLATDAGLVVVDRGWTPLEDADPPVAAALPVVGEVEVEGVLFPSESLERPASFGDDGRLRYVSTVDLARLEDWYGQPVAPLYVLAQTPTGRGDLPVPPPLPEQTEGSHLSYAVQWFLFAGVVVVGFPLLLRRVARDADRGDAAERPPARVGA